MLGQEEFVKQEVHLQQAFAIEFYFVAFNGHEAQILQALDRLREFDDGIDGSPSFVPGILKNTIG